MSNALLGQSSDAYAREMQQRQMLAQQKYYQGGFLQQAELQGLGAALPPPSLCDVTEERKLLLTGEVE